MGVDINCLRQFIDYNPETGLFVRHTLCKADHESSLGPITSIDSGGYIIFSVLGTSYLAHRLAFAFTGLEIPELVDHKNRIRSDNTWLNLRAADKFINAQNRSKPSNNRSGCPGVIYDITRSKYRTYVRFNGKSYTAGRFASFDDAVVAITELKLKLSKAVLCQL